jgi:hypothetical protein
MDYGCESSTAYLSVFSGVRIITFVQNSPIELNVRSTASIGRELLMLEARGSGMLFSS